MAEHETTTRATATRTIHIDQIHRDFEVRSITQGYAAIRELSIVTSRWWHGRTEAIGTRSQAWFLRRCRRQLVDRQGRSWNKRRAKTKKRVGSVRSRLLSQSQLEVIGVSPSLGSRGTLDLLHYLPNGTGRATSRFAWKTPVKSRKYSCDRKARFLTSHCHPSGNPLRSSQERSLDGSQNRPRPTHSSSRRAIWVSRRKHYTRHTWWPYRPTSPFVTNLVNLLLPHSNNPTD